MPVVSIQMSHSPSERDFYEEILVAMGVFSSRLLRVAAENHVRARKLISGFSSVYSDIPLPFSLDKGADRDFLRAFSYFSRVLSLWHGGRSSRNLLSEQEANHILATLFVVIDAGDKAESRALGEV